MEVCLKEHPGNRNSYVLRNILNPVIYSYVKADEEGELLRIFFYW